ncbi:MAG: hypothetical protein B6242_07750 [Anaerolineaceae bacterium 4572_78]|nr:MAG: hypothetical protein B6242_07750 [Anaerolineaceae bacterium 4572_78]
MRKLHQTKKECPKILIVDDQPKNINVLEYVLADVDAELVSALSGKEALYLGIKHSFALAILDVQMPDMNGFELAELLRGNYKTKNMPVIFISAIYSDELDLLKGYKVGAVDFISKPFIPEILLSKVQILLNLHQQTIQLHEKKVELQHFVDQLNSKNVILSKRTIQLETSRYISQRLTSILDLDTLLAEIVDVVQLKFDYYHVHIYLLDVEQERLVMAEGTGVAGKELKKHGHHIPLTKKSLVTRAFHSQNIVMVADVQASADWLPNPLLPETRSEIAVPVIRNEGVIGVLDVQENKVSGLSEEDIQMFRSLANQIATAIHNAQLYRTAQREIAERKHAENALRRSKDRYRTVSRLTSDYILSVQFSYEKKPDNIWHTDGFIRQLGYADDEFEGIEGWQSLIHHEDKLIMDEHLATTLSGETSVSEYRIITKSNEIRWIQSSTHPMWDDAHKNVIGLIIAAKDITERKESSIALKKVNTDLIRLNADKDKLFSIIAHDLRGPFQPLLGMTELLSLSIDKCDDIAEMKQLADYAHQSARNVYELLEKLLQWSRLERGGIPYQPISIDLYEIVTTIVELLSPNATEKGVTLQNHILQGIAVHADKDMLDTVIRNLTTNALKFTPSGGSITFSAVLEHEVGNKKVEVSVSDTGVGMSQDIVDKLFNMGTYHTTLGTNQEKGTGLGLLICKEMAEKNGGNIWIESELGKGTSVKFTVPLAE